MIKSRLQLGLLVLLFPFFFSCKKDIKSVTSIPVNQAPKDGPIPAYYFNWETATNMPSAPSSTTNPVPMPWNSGTSAFDPNLAWDYHASDGWNLVWNTFAPTTILGDPNYTYFFALYNVYRGSLRFYLWQPANGNATSYVEHGLSLYTTGATSPMLNFNVADMANISSNQSTFTQVLQQQIQSAQGSWFVFQYEIAYDANIANLSFPSFGLEWKSKWINVTKVELNGTQIGTIKGYLGSPNSGGFPFGSIVTQGALSFLGDVDYSSLLNILPGKSQTNNENQSPYKKAVNSAIGGIAKGILNGIIGSSSSQTPINLDINTEIKLTGSETSNGGMEDTKLVMPGQSNSQTADGNTPYYNNILGVFNISATPVVKRQNWSYSIPFDDPQSGSSGSFTYQGLNVFYDPNSFQVNFNSAIVNGNSNGTHVANLKIQTVVLSGYLYYPENGVGIGVNKVISGYNPSLQDGTGTIETIGVYSAAISNGSDPMLIYYDNWTPVSYGVRVMFDLIDNTTGQRKATLVKTFVPNVVDVF
ncbi:MAG TPA: hypothetical protein VI233_04735 [Puia sp.]